MPIDPPLKSSDYYFTVFTPTFNREHTLHRVFKSLCSQSYNNFEWLIIDYGSTDKTHELVKKGQAANRFPIRYYYQENQGKHIAWNKAADLAHGEYFLCADSDDEFVPESLESFRSIIETIPTTDRKSFYGAVALCQTPNGGIVGDSYPLNNLYCEMTDLHFDYKVTGDQWYCGRTEIHRNIRFSETFTGSLLPESTIWLRISKSYKVALFNQPLTIVHAEPDSICHTFSYLKHSSISFHN